jgi:murein DD-endopeptidase MepM/ murein hydrolase activator NlpD
LGVLEIRSENPVQTPKNLARNRLIVALLAVAGMAGIASIATDLQQKNLTALDKIERLKTQNNFLSKKVLLKANQVKSLKLEVKAKIETLTAKIKLEQQQKVKTQAYASALSSKVGSFKDELERLQSVGSANAETQPLEDVSNQQTTDVAIVGLNRLSEQSIASLEARGSSLDSIPSGWPLTGDISSTFGYRLNPFNRKLQRHTGWDIATAMGTPIAATANGVVVTAGMSSIGYGLHVIVDHGNGLKTLFGHLSSIEVSLGQEVFLGDEIGLVGSTGNSTGPHLHYEVRLNDAPIDPGPFLVREVSENPMPRLEVLSEVAEQQGQLGRELAPQ